MVSWFLKDFCIHHRPGRFFFEARKVPQKIFFQWRSCTFFSSLPKDPAILKILLFVVIHDGGSKTLRR